MLFSCSFYIYIYESDDLRQSTSHETNGKAKTEDEVQHASDFLSILSHCCFVVKISIQHINIINNSSCSPNWHSPSLSDRSYCLYLFGLGFLLPLTVILVTSVWALRAINTVRIFSKSHSYSGVYLDFLFLKIPFLLN